MITKVELYKDGTRRVFHRTEKGQVSWTHSWEDRLTCEVCQREK